MSAPACGRCGAGGLLLEQAEPVEGGDGQASAPCLACGGRTLLRYDEETGSYALDPADPGRARLAQARRFGSAALALPAGYLLVAAWHTFHWPGQGDLHSVPLGVLTGVVAVALGVAGRGFAGAALGLLVGGLLIAKPFLSPLARGFSLTSESAMNYHTTGAALVLGALVLVWAAWGTLAARRLRPSPAALLALGLGLGLGVAAHRRDTKGDVWARHRDELFAWTERLRVVALAIDDAHVTPPALPGSRDALDPLPTKETTEVLPVARLRDPGPPEVGSADLAQSGPVFRCLYQLKHDDYKVSRFAEPHDVAPFVGLAKLRYVAAYELPAPGRFVVWLADKDGALLARLEASYDTSEEEWRVKDRLVDALVFGR